MEAILNGDESHRRDLEAHLDACPECRARWQELTQLDDALRLVCNTDLDAGDRERAIAGVLRGIGPPRTAARPAAHALCWAAVAVPLLLVGFGSGLCAGRTLWPRQEVVRVPQWRERVVTVKVPFVEERVVVKRVPVLRTRVVYRERTPVPQPEGDAKRGHTATKACTPEVPRATPFTASSVKLTTVVVGFDLQSAGSAPIFTRETRPAAVREPREPEPPGQHDEDGLGLDQTGADASKDPRLACLVGSVHEAP
jgi:hypothetical protein